MIHEALKSYADKADAKPFDWAVEFDTWVKSKLLSRDVGSLVDEFKKTDAGKLSVPTTEHYFPLLYAIGASDEQDELTFEFEGIQNGSISMRSFSYKNRGLNRAERTI